MVKAVKNTVYPNNMKTSESCFVLFWCGFIQIIGRIMLAAYRQSYVDSTCAGEVTLKIQFKLAGKIDKM